MNVLLRSPPISAIAAALILYGCAGDPTAADAGPLFLSIVSGDQQTWFAGRELPDALVVMATTIKNGKERPLANQLVNFRVLAGDGSVFAGAAITNGKGIAQDYWTLGPEPGENVLEVRAVDPTTGEKQVHARFTATARPFPEELNTLRALLGDAFVQALVQRVDPAIGDPLRSALDAGVDALGEPLNLDAVEVAIDEALTLVAIGGPPHLVEFAFLDLVLRRADMLLQQARQVIS